MKNALSSRYLCLFHFVIVGRYILHNIHFPILLRVLSFSSFPFTLPENVTRPIHFFCKPPLLPVFLSFVHCAHTLKIYWTFLVNTFAYTVPSFAILYSFIVHLCCVFPFTLYLNLCAIRTKIISYVFYPSRIRLGPRGTYKPT